MNEQTNLSRRNFLMLGGGAALTVAMAGPTAAQTAEAPAPAVEIKRKIKLGLIGCGNRGNMIAKLMIKHGGFDLFATADYFQEQADKVGETNNVSAQRRFSGLSCYKRLLASGVEAVAIESPPYFHPEQAAAAVAAGVHVYCAKPVAVDVPGCQTIAQRAQQATAKKLCFLVDFQTRSTPAFIEALKRVHAGDMGTITFGEGIYHADCPFTRHFDALSKDPNDSETRLRAWGLDRALSGDMITEQNVHTLDIMNWVMQQPPISANATGALTARPKLGTCFDHYTGLFDYGNGVGVTFSSKQFNGYDTIPSGIRLRMFGSQGVLEAEYGGQVLLRGEKFYNGGKTPGIYHDGVVANIATFYGNIIEGHFENITAAPSVQSTLITILGRTAAYRGTTVAWQQIAQSTERLEADLRGLKD